MLQGSSIYLWQLPDVKDDYYFALSMQFLLLFIFYGDCE